MSSTDRDAKNPSIREVTMKPKSMHPSSRGDPLSIVSLVTAFALALAFTANAQDRPTGPADTATRTAAQALLAQDVPDDQIALKTPTSVAEPEGILPEPRFIARMMRFATRSVGDGSNTKNGFFPEFSNMVTGSGWISLGPGYRHWFSGDRAIVEGSTAISWRGYKMAQGRFEFSNIGRSRVSVGSQALWQDLTQVTYFGPGEASLEDARSEYRLKSTDVVGYATVRPIKWLAITGRAGYLFAPTLMDPGGKFQRGNPSALVTFANDPNIALEAQPGYVHSEASVTADTRDSRSHPAHGGIYRAAMSVYADRDTGTFSFQRYEAEAAQFVSLASDKLMLAARGWIVGSASGDDNIVPFYMLPSLGGHNTLRAYTDYRFHDRNLAVVNAEARVALITHLDLAAFVDAGNVAPRMSELNLDKRSYGIGLRMHTNRATVLRVDAAHGTDGWRFIIRTSEPFHLSRLSKRIAAVPFAP
jgi:hypothetical protein